MLVKPTAAESATAAEAACVLAGPERVAAKWRAAEVSVGLIDAAGRVWRAVIRKRQPM